MPSFRTAFPSKYLKADDLTAPVSLTIARADVEVVGQGDKQEAKLVVHFREEPKGLVLNLINSETIAELCGTEDYTQWPGHLIQIFPTRTEFAGKRVPCLRVREAAKAAKPPKGPRRRDDLDEAKPTAAAESEY